MNVDAANVTSLATVIVMKNLDSRGIAEDIEI